jgi:O-antigen/teichoic acid export membrane protein
MSFPSDSGELARSFRRGFATLFAVDLVNKALAAITVVVLIRGLSVSSYAYATLLLTLAQFTTSAAAGGVSTRYLREESERISRGGRQEEEELFFTSLVKAVTLVAISGVCTLPLAHLFGAAGNPGWSLALFASVFAIGWAATDLSIARFQARRRFLAAGGVTVIRAAALLAGSLIIVLASQRRVAVGVGLAASAFAVGLVTARGAARLGSSQLRAGNTFRPTREEAWLSFYSVASAGFAYVDVLVAGTLLNSHQVATLGAALRYWAVVLGAIPALGAILRVRTAQVDIVDSRANQRSMLYSWIRRATIPAVVLVGVTAALAPVLIPKLDGGKYPGSVSALQIFLITALVAYVTAPAGVILLAQRRYGVLAVIQAGGLAVNLAGDIAVARPFGVLGIAVVSSVAYTAVGLAVTLASLSREGPTKSRSGAEHQRL